MRILIADDHAIVRQGLASLFEGLNDVQVVGEVDNGEKAIQQARELSPDIVIMDVSMPGLNGIDAARQILAHRPEVKVIILSMHVDSSVVTEALKAGCMGYVLKSCLLQEIGAALAAATRNEHYLSPRVTSLLVEAHVREATVEGNEDKRSLTAREREVLRMVAEGLSTKQIAQRLSLGVKAVETIRHRIKGKLHLDSVAELTKYAIQVGLTSGQI